jgi:allophanate hydrolase
MRTYETFGIASLTRAYRDGTLTPSSVAAEVLTRIEAGSDPAVWISRIAPDALLERARTLEADHKARALPLYGIPFAVKDNIDAKGLPTTAACPAFAYEPTANATSVQRLLDAGAMLVGKTNLDQFATGLVGTRSPYGAPRCVFDSAHVSGGSSSGSAVAVASGLVSFALGTDTAGSGRVPAGFNNIVGLKPTKGLVSTAGVVPACRSIDCVSIFAQTAPDAAAVLAVLRGEDAADAFSRPDQDVALPPHFRFGVLSGADLDTDGDASRAALYHAAAAHLENLGGTPVTIDFGIFREAAALLYDGPFVAERLAAIEPFFRAHAEAMDPTVRSIVAGADRHSAADAFRGLYKLRALARAAATQWEAMDLLLVPTSPSHPTIAEVEQNPIGANSRLGRYTNFVNLLDYAAIAVPAGFRANGLPAGVTLIGPAFSDRSLARLGERLHDLAACGSGVSRATGYVDLAVAGAHLSGMALNHQLTDLGATLTGPARTAADYRLFALPGTTPPKPGLVRAPGFTGAGIALEIWRLSPAAFGRFVAALPQPMAIGRVHLADGSSVAGFLCEPCAVEGAVDITAFGGWRAYVASTLR